MNEEQTPHEMVNVGGFPMEIRSEKHGVDLGWLRFVMTGNRYWSHVHPEPGQRWLDVGAFLGGFSVVAASRGAMCFAFEPAPVTFDMLCRNVQRNGMWPTQELVIKGSGAVWCYQACLTMRPGETVDFYLNRHRKKAAHSMYVTGGRDHIKIANTHIDTAVLGLGITHIKSDSEGAEWEVLMGMSDTAMGQIREATFTYHRAMLKDKDLSKYAQLIERLKHHFPYMTYREPASIGGNWTVNVHCKR